MQGPSELSVALRTGAKGLVLRRLPTNSPAARMTALVNEVGWGLGGTGTSPPWCTGPGAAAAAGEQGTGRQRVGGHVLGNEVVVCLNWDSESVMGHELGPKTFITVVGMRRGRTPTW